MKHIKLAFTLFIFIMLLIPLSCTIRYYDTNKLANDFTSEGFLDSDHYQVTIKGMPDNSSRGLVEQRESALKNAKSIMEDIIIHNLANYSLEYHVQKLKIKDVNDIQNLTEIKKELPDKMRKFLDFGHIAFEYYNPDNSAVIVYRLFKEDLKEKIEAVNPGIKLKED